MISDMEVIEEILLGFIIKVEIRSVIISTKVGKVFGVDCIIVELFKVDIITIVDIFYDFFCEIWVSEIVFVDWRKGFIVKIVKKGDFIKCGNW